jgi:hypothetical protein
MSISNEFCTILDFGTYLYYYYLSRSLVVEELEHIWHTCVDVSMLG